MQIAETGHEQRQNVFVQPVAAPDMNKWVVIDSGVRATGRVADSIRKT